MVHTPDDLLLTDRVAIVTGAGQGIGAAVARSLHRFGSYVAVVDRDPSGLDEVDADLTEVFDVRDGAALTAFVQRVAAELGRIDILVNNAGGGFEAGFVEVSARGEAALISENFTSVTHGIRAVVPHMEAGGSIVNVTSIEAHRAAPGFAVYAAMKAAVANLTMSLALELGDRRIRVNCVAPDVIPTPGVGELAGVAERTALPFAGHVDDVAAAVVWLAGDGARFVTGSTVHVDGGNRAAAGWVRQADGRWHP